MEEKNKKRELTIIIVTVLITLFVTLGVVYLLFLRKPDKSVNNGPQVEIEQSQTSTSEKGNEQPQSSTSEKENEQPQSSTSNTKTNDNQTITTTAKEYKTNDGKYVLKISADGKKVYLNNREIIESTKRVESGRYLQIWGEFSESFNYISNLTFVIDKEKKIIVDPTTVKPIAQEDKDGLGEYARFSSRPGFMFININGHDLFAFEYEIGADIYTTNWKKIGYIFTTAKEIKYDNGGIYICGDEDETRELNDLECHNEVKYDFNGNRIG